MLKRLMNHFVYMASHKNEHGFTFITMLIMITILSVSLPFLAYLTKSASYNTNYSEISIQQFFQFLRNDAMNATGYNISSSKLYLELNNGTTATIEKYEDQIRRQVNGVGHEVYLRDIKEISFISLSFGFKTIVTSSQGERYEKTIVFYE